MERSEGDKAENAEREQGNGEQGKAFPPCPERENVPDLAAHSHSRATTRTREWGAR